ncbi:MAG: protein-glutamate O-methyltransferase CheR [Proteobacteria bacterium]|nr:protein-glutamate O-methyltransferase CheR [Pseudomonadota bacterium]
MTGSQDTPAIDGEFHLTTADFNVIAKIILAEAGIALSENKGHLVYSRLAKRLRALGLSSFREYCAVITGDDGETERQTMIAALTTNVTRFFREPHHFEHLKTQVLPPLLQQAKRGGRVRIWSAACSSGQEPYSIGMTMLSLMPDIGRHDVKILASDIDPNMLRDGRTGVYPESAMDSVPAALRARWFTNEGPGLVRAGEELRSLVTFRKLNLIGNWPMQGRFHAIFCRNVVIYFSGDTQAQVWARFVPLLEPDGVLYIGHSERISGSAEQKLRSDGVTTYRSLVSAPAAP